MKFVPTGLNGAYVIEADPLADERGFFARLWCQEEFSKQGIELSMVQSSVSHNAAAGTLRGLHFQWPPSLEAKLVRCERGRIFEVMVDLRPHSSTFTKHFALELDAGSHASVYIPAGFAHGFQTLEADSTVIYVMSDYFQPALAAGVRFDDPVFAIDWPLPVNSIIDRDRDYPNFDSAAHSHRYSQALKQGEQQQ